MGAYYDGLVMRAQRQINELVSQKLGELHHAINVECDAKNKAYYFILENGYFDQYSEWCKRKNAAGPTGRQAHRKAVGLLANKAMDATL